MTNELEKQFFDTFGIEPIKKQESELVAIGENIRGLKRVEKPFYEYPQITDSILLNLICIATASEITVEFKRIKNVEHLKEVVLNYCIRRYGYCLHKDNFKRRVRALFMEEYDDR